MRVFIDESGSFAPVDAPPSPSLVGALVIPDEKWDRLVSKYQRIRSRLPKEDGEVKGRRLNEAQVAEVIDLLRRNSAIFEANVAEMAIHHAEVVVEHRKRAAEGLTGDLTDQHHPDLVATAHALRKNMENLKVPAYVQSFATYDLLYRVLDHATVYFSQRMPAELGHFEWVFDGKGDFDGETAWETWWRQVLLPMLQSMSIRKPGGRLIGGDYSYFDKFCIDEVPEYIAHLIDAKDRRSRLHVDLAKVFRDNTRFSSRPEPGLELVDIVTNAVRRALIGNLGPDGWRDIPKLMIHRRRGPYLGMVFVGTGELPRMTLGYEAVVKRFSRNGRSMLTPSLRRPEDEDRYRAEGGL